MQSNEGKGKYERVITREGEILLRRSLWESVDENE
jgi:hypothetical protein